MPASLPIQACRHADVPPCRRLACRTWPAGPGLPAGVGRRARRRAKLFPPFAGRASPERITSHYAAHFAKSALWSGAFCAGRLFPAWKFPNNGPGMALLRCDGKWPGVRAAASGREAGRRHRVTLSLAATGRTARGWHPEPRERVTAGCAPAEGPRTARSDATTGRPGPGRGLGLARIVPSPPATAPGSSRAPGPRWPYPSSLIADPDIVRPALISAYGPGTPSR